MAGNYNRYYRNKAKFWISPLVNSKAGIDIAMLFTRWSSGFASSYDPTGRFQIRPNKEGKPDDFRFIVYPPAAENLKPET